MRGRERGGGALVSPGRMFVRKLLEVARQLGIQTVAEGIETPEELRWVRAPGVDFVQGYLSSRPRAAPATRFFTG